MEALEPIASKLAFGLDRNALQQEMPAGAARNALDCAFWDLEAKRAGKPAHELAGLAAPHAAHHRLHDLDRHAGDDGGGRQGRGVAARFSRSSSAAPAMPSASPRCAAAAPQSELIVDANEGWTADNLAANLAACADGRRHADRAAAARRRRRRARSDPAAGRRSAPTRACTTARASAALAGRYDAVNIKLDKTGGLTEALAMAEEAERLGFGIMVGCMVATSLAMAPAMLVAQRARVVDLDGAAAAGEGPRRTGYATTAAWFTRRHPALWG